jgi:hypothetical protein
VNGVLEPLGPQKGVDQVDEEACSDGAAKAIFDEHGHAPLEALTSERVGNRQGEETEAERQQDHVQHGMLLSHQLSAKTSQARGIADVGCSGAYLLRDAYKIETGAAAVS